MIELRATYINNGIIYKRVDKDNFKLFSHILFGLLLALFSQITVKKSDVITYLHNDPKFYRDITIM